MVIVRPELELILSPDSYGSEWEKAACYELKIDKSLSHLLK
jgi:hypothetical protein